MFNIILICLVGIIIGLLSSVTGILFSGLAILSLKYLDVGDYKTILGTMLYILLFPLSICSVSEFYKEKKINFFVGNLLLITFIIGGYFGSKLVLNDYYNLSEKKIKYLTAILTLFSSSLFFVEAYNL
jgi:uncharacterized membrane protein YfcA